MRSNTGGRIALIAVLCIVACGGEPTGGGESDGDGSGSGSSTTAVVSTTDVVDASTGSSSGDTTAAVDTSSGGSDTGEPTPAVNTFFLSSGIFLGGGISNIVVSNAVAAEGERCRFETMGECHTIDCTPVAPGDPPPPLVGAGTITLRRGDEDLLSTTPDPATNEYPAAYTMTSLWEPGEMLTLDAVGDEIPAFAVDLVGPSFVEVLEPTMSVVAPFAAPFHVAWTPTEGGVTIAASQVPLEGVLVGRRFMCEADAMLGEFDVPPEVLAVLEPGVATLNIGGNFVTDLELEGHPVHVHVVRADTYEITMR